MNRIFVDNNIVSEMQRDIDFKMKVYKLYPRDKFIYYINFGTVVEQVRWMDYNKEKLKELDVMVLLNSADMKRAEEDKAFTEIKIENDVRIMHINEVLDTFEEDYLQSLVKELDNKTDEIHKEWNEDVLKKRNVVKATSLSGGSNNKFINQYFDKLRRPKVSLIFYLINKTENIYFILENKYYGMRVMTYLKEHRAVILQRKVETNDVFDIEQSIWYPYMDVLIIENKQKTYLEYVKNKEEMKFLRTVKFESLNTIRNK